MLSLYTPPHANILYIFNNIFSVFCMRAKSNFSNNKHRTSINHLNNILLFGAFILSCSGTYIGKRSLPPPNEYAHHICGARDHTKDIYKVNFVFTTNTQILHINLTFKTFGPSFFFFLYVCIERKHYKPAAYLSIVLLYIKNNISHIRLCVSGVKVFELSAMHGIQRTHHLYILRRNEYQIVRISISPHIYAHVRFYFQVLQFICAGVEVYLCIRFRYIEQYKSKSKRPEKVFLNSNAALTQLSQFS